MTDKTQQIHFRVSDSEKEMIRAKAKQANMTISEYMVALAKERKIFSLPDLPNLILQISRIGNNINQIAAAANSKRFVSAEQIEKTQDYQRELINIVSKILREVRSSDELPAVSADEKFDERFQKLNRDMHEINKKLGLLFDYVMKKD